MVVTIHVSILTDVEVEPKATDGQICDVVTNWVESNLRDYIDFEIKAIGTPLK